MDTNNDGAVSEDEFLQYRTRFLNALDADKDGVITRDEFVKLAEPPYVEANDPNLPPLDQRRRFLNDQFTALDTDQDGKLTQAEAVAAFKVNFQQLDRDRDGKITVADMTAPEPAKQITRAQFIENDTKTFDKLDTNKDGKLSMDEFAVLGAGAPPEAASQVKEQLAA
ncbi:MAG: EF-hand domain-containing protein, partial [Rhodospirillales bacterium]